MVLVLTAVFVVAVVATQSRSMAAGICDDPNGYLFQYSSGPTQVDQIDMVTGQQQANIATIFGREINAVGYNPLDNNFYGWDNQQTTFVRESDDFLTTTPLIITGYSGPTTGNIIGDVDDQGHYWQLDGNTWYEIDVTTATPSLIATGTVSGPTGSAGADWAFVPGTDNLYRTMDNGTDISVWAFSRTNHTWTDVATATNMTAGGDRTIGANYADPYNHLFASSNGSGKLWEIDLSGIPANPPSPVSLAAVLVGTGNPSSTNDGARCSLAPIPTDFGDAPNSYHTLLANDGPRHNVVSYDATDHTAPLMLGQKVDIEADGYSTAGATGDDTNGINDEDAIGSITVGGKTAVAVALPITVTNNAATAGTLAGWIDSNNNGVFDTGERATANIAASSGTKQYTLTFPSIKYTASTYLRLRVYSGSVSDPQPTGPVTGGEIEDHFVQVNPALSGVVIGTPGAPSTGYSVFHYNILRTLVVYGMGAFFLVAAALTIRRIAQKKTTS